MHSAVSVARRAALSGPRQLAAVRSIASAAGSGGEVPFLLADIGEGIAEVEILQWFVKPGDSVEQFDRVAEVQSDKATVEISSPYVGVIKSLAYEVGDIAKVGTPLLHITLSAAADEQGSAHEAPAAPPAPAAAAPAAAAASAPAASSAVGSGGEVPFLLADIGEGIAEVEILQWFVKPGDSVEQFDRVAEVQSDKATVEISSPYVGVIKSLAYQVGDIAKVGTPLVHIALAADDKTGAAPAAAAPATAAAVPAAAVPSAAQQRGKVLSTPATRAMAKRHKIDLSTVPGTGRDGRVTKEDLLRHLEGLGASPTPPQAAAAPPPPPPPPSQPAAAAKPAQPVAAAKPAPAVAPAPAAEDRTMPIRGIRRAMFAQMTAANAIPHFGYCDEVVMDELSAAREQLKPLAAELGLAKFTLMPLIVKATSVALLQFPELNSSISEDGSQLIIKASHNIGVAMDTPNGLLVPNIKAVQNKTLLQIGQELARLQTDAAAGKLGMDDLKGGTFTLSNIGNLGGTYTGPVINLPEVAIAGLGKARPTPRYDANGELVRRMVMQVSWSADHRVVDGAMMARFSNAWISLLERPAKLLMYTR